MPDHATSTSPAVQAQLDRLWALSPGADILGLERITTLLARLGNPHARLPPVFHVAGTNGKGSTCAFLRGAIEAAGYTAHVYTSPHLVHFNERIRLAGKLIEDDALAVLLTEVLDQATDIGASFFEVTTAAAFLAFARTPADACIIEVGLGGRLDATNVITAPAVAGIAQLGIDHQSFLGNSAEDIAGEKAGIAKPGVPLVTMRYPAAVAARVASVARQRGAVLMVEGDAWDVTLRSDKLIVSDADGFVEAPLPAMAGPHQPGNLALAIAMLRHQSAMSVGADAIARAAHETRWPARMQRLGAGPLMSRLPPGSALWLDGGHNPAAAAAVSTALREHAGGQPVHLVLGMLANKDPVGLLAPFAPFTTSVHAVPVDAHEHHRPEALADMARSMGMVASPADNIAAALDAIAASAAGSQPPVVLILGSLYLAGTALTLNGELPD